MMIQLVKFETALTEAQVRAVATERAPEFRAIPTLLQKYYLKFGEPNRYGGLYIWQSPEAIAEYRASDLAKSIPAAYQVTKPPEVDIHEVLFPLRT